MPADAVVAAEGVTIAYPGAGSTALRDFSLAIGAGPSTARAATPKAVGSDQEVRS